MNIKEKYVKRINVSIHSYCDTNKQKPQLKY